MESGDRKRSAAAGNESKFQRSNLRNTAGDFVQQLQLRVASSRQSDPGPRSGRLSRAGAAANGPKIITLGIGDDEALHPCQSVNTSVQANTPYAFVFTGFDVEGPVTLSGSFAADPSGNLTGIEDIIRSSGAQLAQPLTAGSAILFQ